MENTDQEVGLQREIVLPTSTDFVNGWSKVASTVPKQRTQLVYELREFYHIFRNLYVKNSIFSFLH